MDIELLPPIRNAVRALIFRDQHVLLLRKRGERYALPGGGQDLSESLIDALQRECEEEIGSKVDVIGLAGVCEWGKVRDTVPPSRRHLVEFLYRCHVSADYTPHNGFHPDKNQLEVVWVPIQQLASLHLPPVGMAQILISLVSSESAATDPYYGWLG